MGLRSVLLSVVVSLCVALVACSESTQTDEAGDEPSSEEISQSDARLIAEEIKLTFLIGGLVSMLPVQEEGDSKPGLVTREQGLSEGEAVELAMSLKQRYDERCIVDIKLDGLRAYTVTMEACTQTIDGYTLTLTGDVGVELGGDRPGGGREVDLAFEDLEVESNFIRDMKVTGTMGVTLDVDLMDMRTVAAFEMSGTANDCEEGEEENVDCSTGGLTASGEASVSRDDGTITLDASAEGSAWASLYGLPASVAFENSFTAVLIVPAVPLPRAGTIRSAIDGVQETVEEVKVSFVEATEDVEMEVEIDGESLGAMTFEQLVEALEEGE